MEQIPLFVFGTLQRGESNHHHLAGHYERMIPAVLTGFGMIDSTIGFPMIGRDSHGRVAGELYFIKPAEYDATMAGCDELEELYPGQMTGADYRRLLVQVETDAGIFPAWAYVSTQTEA